MRMAYACHPGTTKSEAGGNQWCQDQLKLLTQIRE